MSLLREIVLDTETTGLSPQEGHRVIEIGCVELVDRMVTGRTFHVYINPERDVPAAAEAVHGLSTVFLQDKPKFAAIADDFVEFIAGGSLVIHNAGFDMAFLNAEFERLKRPALSGFTVIDTLMLARRKFPGGGNKLDDLCARFGIDNTKRTFHGALLDSELLAEVYIELTGGRQRQLGLVSEAIGGGAEGDDDFKKPAKQRSQPLASRLSEDEKLAHQQLVQKLGENAFWTDYSK